MPKQNALPKKARITSATEFNNIIKKGKCIKADFFRVHLLENKGSKSRIGVIISRHIKVKALKNRYKRWIREFFRLYRAHFKISLDIVVIVFRSKKGTIGPVLTEMLKREKIIS